MITFIKYLFLIYTKLVGKIFYYWHQFFNFYYPNRKSLLRKKLIVKGFPVCGQITFYQGDGVVEIGENCYFGLVLGGFHRGGSITLQSRFKNSRIKFGNNIWTNNNIMLSAANYIEIGDNTLIGQYVTILDHEAHGIEPQKRRKIGKIGSVIIGKNVWIGSNVTILKNSSIGNNTIIATGAVVSGVFPANVIIGGIPAKIIKNI